MKIGQLKFRAPLKDRFIAWIERGIDVVEITVMDDGLLEK